MTCKTIRNEDSYRLKLWRILTNPTVEVAAMIGLMFLAAWVIVDSEALMRVPHPPVLFGK